MRHLVVLLLVLFIATTWAATMRPLYVVGSHAMSEHEAFSPSNERTRASAQPLTPTVLKAVYGVSTTDMTLGAGITVAIIDAYSAPTAESDLATFNQRFGLPAATTANGMFRRVDQNGGTNYPAADPDWGFESALDIQAVHSMAPGAKILYVGCNSASDGDLYTGVDTAVRMGAKYISMSFSGAESSTDAANFDKHFNVAGVSFFASTGDDGSAGGIGYPSSSKYVVAVGGTTISTSNGAFASESGWSGSGGGCSAYAVATSAQQANSGYASLGCNGKKALPDLSMVGDPASGLTIYYTGDTSQCTAPNCWFTVGGTSLSSPLTAARAAIRGVQITPSYVYTGSISFRDVVTGSNGAYSCKAGLDKVTGRGSWIGIN